MAKVGYARVSKADQHPEVQRDRLEAAGCEKVFADHGVSGRLASRPAWDECLSYLRRGDVLVVVRLDRIGRSVRNLIDVVTELGERGVDLMALDQAIDTTSPAGRLTFHIMSAIAEFERDLIRERTMDGLAAARARGRKGGRKAVLSARQEKVIAQMYASREHTIAEIAGTFGVGASTVYRSLRRSSAIGKA